MLVLLTKVNTHQSGKVNSGQDLWSDKSKGEKSEGDGSHDNGFTLYHLFSLLQYHFDLCN